MANFYNKQGGGNGRGGFGGNRGGFGGGRGFGGGGRGFGGGGFGGPKPMHPAVCSDCGNDCQVPFRPNGVKPVRCQDCFHKEDGGGFAPRDRAREFDDRPRAFASRPERSAPAPRPSAPSNDEVVRQLKQLNEKMDELLDVIAELLEGGEEHVEEMETDGIEDEMSFELDEETEDEA